MDSIKKIWSWSSDSGHQNQKTIIGWLEQVYLPEYDFVVKAKIDTGAKNSSIHGMDVKYIGKAKGEGSRIRFDTVDLNGIPCVIEADVLRKVKIKRAGSLRASRPEIELEICLGGLRKRIRVNLTDRSGMNYRMILGRTALEGDFVVDVSKKYAVGSKCEKK
jgi:hypothetical protein